MGSGALVLLGQSQSLSFTQLSLIFFFLCVCCPTFCLLLFPCGTNSFWLNSDFFLYPLQKLVRQQDMNTDTETAVIYL